MKKREMPAISACVMFSLSRRVASSHLCHRRLDEFLEQVGLEAIAVESVNLPRLSSVVLCKKSGETG